jgi:hypothetical protein
VSLLTNLLAYFKFDEASGNALDAHGDSELVQLSGTIASTTGKINNARDFEAGDTEFFQDWDTLGIFGDEDFTIACWIHAESIPASVMDVCGNLSANDGWKLSKKSTNEIEFTVGYTSGTAQVATDSQISASTWYFIAGKHDAANNQIAVYINGTEKTASHSLGLTEAPLPIRVGRSGSSNYWDGLIDELGIWDRVLSESELDVLYNGGAGLPYPLGSGTGTATLTFSGFETSAVADSSPPPGEFTATAAATFGGFETTATATYTLPPPGTYTGTSAFTFGNLETVAAGIAGLHYPNSATTYDIADIDPFYDPFNRYDWTNPNDGRFDDSTYASVTLTPAQGGFTYVLEVSNFAFNVPLHSRIDGIKVEIERRKTGTAVDTDWSIFDVLVQLSKTSGSVVGTNKQVGTEYPEAFAYASYGGSTDLWGASWTAAEINATGFGVAFAAGFINNSADFDGTVEVDAIRATVFFTPPHAGTATLAFAGLDLTATGFTLPKHTGTAVLVFGGVETTAVADTTNPTYSGAAAPIFAGFDITGTASFSDVVHLGTAAVTFGGLDTTATGATHSIYTGTAAQTLGGFETTAAGTVLRPVFAGSAALTFKRIQTTAAADSTVPTYSGQLTATFPAFDMTAVADFNPPVSTGTAARTFGNLEFTGTGTTTEPVYTGTAAITLPALDTSLNALFVPQQFVDGQAALAMPPFTISGWALQIDPVYTGEGAFTFAGATTQARSTPLRGIHFHGGTLSDQEANGMSLGAVIETEYTFIEGYRETVKIEFVDRLGPDLFIGTPGVTEIGKRSVDILDPRINDSLENIDGIIATPGQALMCDVEVTAAKKQPTVLRFDCNTNNAARSFVVDFHFHTQR